MKRDKDVNARMYKITDNIGLINETFKISNLQKKQEHTLEWKTSFSGKETWGVKTEDKFRTITAYIGVPH